MRKEMALARAVGRNDVNRIEAICVGILKDDPCDQVTLITLADMYWRNELPEKALPYVLKSLELEPHNFYALRTLLASMPSEASTRPPTPLPNA
jgi:hypothetical protein